MKLWLPMKNLFRTGLSPEAEEVLGQAASLLGRTLTILTMGMRSSCRKRSIRKTIILIILLPNNITEVEVTKSVEELVPTREALRNLFKPKKYTLQGVVASSQDLNRSTFPLENQSSRATSEKVREVVTRQLVAVEVAEVIRIKAAIKITNILTITTITSTWEAEAVNTKENTGKTTTTEKDTTPSKREEH